LGPIGTNCFVVSRSGEEEALVVDPGEDPGRVDETLRMDGLRCVGILVTHAHFDHVGAVAPLARQHGAPVYISAGEAQGLRSINDHTWPGFGRFEPYEPDVELVGDDSIELANLAITTHLAPGHSPASIVYVISDPSDGDTALFVGDVIFRGSVGRTDFPGCSWAVLERSILGLYASCPLDAPVYSGHSAPTTLAHERRTNPFLDAVRSVR
jgi:glyoxylase-like metal-dependent hydrolase (beta-lactamase superfamily II)